jgi:DNA polymerase V
MFALVDANSFYASCERVFQPALLDRPVVVLSNNDGCIIARSAKAKLLGIDMGEPFFKIKHLLREKNVAVFSSNYTLYADMSRRVQDVLRAFSDEMEVYSIDESFLHWPFDLPWEEFGREMLNTVKLWTGLPVGVGIGPTKTLAKLANHLAKRGKNANGVHVLDSTKTELMNIWGISVGFCRRLLKIGIKTPLQFRDAEPQLIREHLGVVGQRMVYELRGESCIGLETVVPNKQNICCSRSFGKVTNDPVALREAVATFAAQAAAKMRRQDLVAERVAVFVQTDRHAAVIQYGNSWATRLAVPTNDSREICNSAAWCLSKIYRREHQYKKAGVLLLDLGKRTVAQTGLFEDGRREETNRLMMTLDEINKKHGRGAIRLASTSSFGLGPCRTWHLRSEHRSPRYTTRWDELPVAMANGDVR